MTQCKAYADFGTTRLRCERDENHADVHKSGNTVWRNRAASGEQSLPLADEAPHLQAMTAAAGATIFLPDVSNVGNAGLTLEPKTVAVNAKATEGTTFTDPSYAGFKKQAKSVGAFFGGYHWLWSASDAEMKHAFGKIGKTPAHWDAENLSVKTTVPMILEATKKYRALGGVVHFVYLPHWYWQEHLGSPDLTPLAKAGLHLISSNYTSYSDNGPGWDPYGGMTPAQWQYADNFPYGVPKRPTDFAAFKGTLAHYKALYTGKSAPKPPTPQPKPQPQPKRPNIDKARAALTEALKQHPKHGPVHRAVQAALNDLKGI